MMNSKLANPELEDRVKATMKELGVKIIYIGEKFNYDDQARLMVTIQGFFSDEGLTKEALEQQVEKFKIKRFGIRQDSVWTCPCFFDPNKVQHNMEIYWDSYDD